LVAQNTQVLVMFIDKPYAKRTTIRTHAQYLVPIDKREK